MMNSTTMYQEMAESKDDDSTYSSKDDDSTSSLYPMMYSLYRAREINLTEFSTY